MPAMYIDVVSVLACALTSNADLSMAMIKFAKVVELVTVIHRYHPTRQGCIIADNIEVPIVPIVQDARSQSTKNCESLAPRNCTKSFVSILTEQLKLRAHLLDENFLVMYKSMRSSMQDAKREACDN